MNYTYIFPENFAQKLAGNEFLPIFMNERQKEILNFDARESEIQECRTVPLKEMQGVQGACSISNY